jgi:hypothetical protein
MANTHYGEIGDIWKHLPLAEILAIERPRRYWESRRLGLLPSPFVGQGLRRGHLYRHAPDAPTLRDSAFGACCTRSRATQGSIRALRLSPWACWGECPRLLVL